jgi:hypothetical protein
LPPHWHAHICAHTHTHTPHMITNMNMKNDESWERNCV